MPLGDRHLVELLDRRFDLLENQTGQEYLLHLIAFADFLFSDPQILAYVRQLLTEFQERAEIFDRELAEEIELITALREDTLRAYQDLDDSDMQPPESIIEGVREYEGSLAYFDDLVRGDKRVPGESIPSSVGPYDDYSIPRILLNILSSKIRIKMDEDDARAKEQRAAEVKVDPIPPELDGLWVNCRTLEEGHTYRHRAFANYRRTSPGQALANTRDIAQRLNRQPAVTTSLGDSLQSRSMADIMGYGYMDNILYEDNPGTTQLNRLVDACRQYARIAYEGLRETIGRLGARMQIVERYKTRCTWYQASTIRAIGESEGELGLTRHLALFLFDQGLPVVTRLRLGVHEFDVADLASGTILVEAKTYSGSQTRSRVKADVIQGVSQVHSYLNSFEAATGIREAYLVVIRRGGALLDMPDRINTPRFSIFPVVIDVGKASDSGRRQPKPLVITAEQIESAFQD